MALIAETAVWPNFCLMNIFFALKGSKLFIIICKQVSKFVYPEGGCCRQVSIFVSLVVWSTGGCYCNVVVVGR